MNVLLIGGTGLTGQHITRELVTAGHRVCRFHRGVTDPRNAGDAIEVEELLGDKADLLSHRPAFERFAPDVVVHMLALTTGDAEAFAATFRGLTERAVVISSADVYRAYGRLHRTEPGPIEPMPLAEDDPLRELLGPEGEAYDKVGVERIVGAAGLDVTIVRYPAVYGPGDSQRRFGAHIAAMAAGATTIELRAGEAEFCFGHAYAEDAAHAVVLAATRTAPSHVYNVAERETPTTVDRVSQIGRLMGWRGTIIVRPHETAPRVDTSPASPNFTQHLVFDSSRIREELGFSEVVPLQEGWQRTIAWTLATSAADNRQRSGRTLQ